mgnify:CR=1 FL=1
MAKVAKLVAVSLLTRVIVRGDTDRSWSSVYRENPHKPRRERRIYRR